MNATNGFDFTNGPILSAGTPLIDIINSAITNNIGGFSGWSSSTGLNSIIANNGTGNIASNSYAVAFGSGNTASGSGATAFGIYTLASGVLSTTFGEYTTGSTTTTLAGGAFSLASGVGAFSYGNSVSATSTNSFAIGKYTIASGAESFAGGLGGSMSGAVQANGIGNFNFSHTSNSYSGSGISSTVSYSAILGGQDNSIIGDGVFSTIFGGIQNLIIDPDGNSIIAGSGNTLDSCKFSTIIGSINNSAHSLSYVNMIGTSGRTADADYTTYVENLRVYQDAQFDTFMDFVPQSTLPPASQGRVFFSGSPLYRLMVNTGGTSADWYVI